MEDEEGELFNNTYLDDLKFGGRLSPTSRDSLSLEEIQRRNSLCPPHLKSTYSAQYTDQNVNIEDMFKVFYVYNFQIQMIRKLNQ